MANQGQINQRPSSRPPKAGKGRCQSSKLPGAINVRVIGFAGSKLTSESWVAGWCLLCLIDCLRHCGLFAGFLAGGARTHDLPLVWIWIRSLLFEPSGDGPFRVRAMFRKRARGIILPRIISQGYITGNRIGKASSEQVTSFILDGHDEKTQVTSTSSAAEKTRQTAFPPSDRHPGRGPCWDDTL